MKKKFLCLFLVVMMLVTAMASCSSDEDKLSEELQENQARLTKTLVVYLMSEKEVKSATEIEIEEEVNALTKSKYKTQLDLRFYTPDKYYTELEKAIKAQEVEYNKAKKEEQEIKEYNRYLKESCDLAGIPVITVKPPATKAPATADETIYNAEYGILEYKYPDATANQVNIFYLGGYEKYQSYIDNDWLEPLDAELEYTSKKLKEHIPAVYMDNLTAAGVYGIPNNSLIGNYKWLLLKKDLMEKYFYTPESISASLTDPDLKNFLGDIKEFEVDENKKMVVAPIKGELSPTNMFYWSYDESMDLLVNRPSIMGTSCGNTAPLGQNLSVNSIFHDKNYVEQLKLIKEFETNGYCVDSDSDLPFAMAIMEGSYDICVEYGDEYYVKMIEAPKVDNTQIYDNMFCVNKFASVADTDNTKRCMEIITYINTNPELRNILQYGIKDKNYTIDSNGVLKRSENTGYFMDINKTGNIFMAHPEEGMPANLWEAVGVEHSENLAINPTSGFTFDSNSEGDLDSFIQILSLTDDYMKRIDECKTAEDIDALVKAAKAELSANPYYNKVVNPLYPSDNSKPSLGCMYDQWLNDNGYKIQ